MQEHDEPGFGEGAREPLEPVLFHASVAVGHRDRRTRASLPVRLEEPTAEAIAALDLEIYVATLNHQFSITARVGDKKLKAGPGDRATAGYC